MRHPRFRGHSQADWRDTDLQHHGRQTVDELNYIMESKPEKGLYVFMHNQLPMDASRRPCRSRRGNWRDILGKQALEADPGLQVLRREVDCERLAGHPPLVPGAGAIAWEQTLRLASRFVRHHRPHSHDAVAVSYTHLTLPTKRIV